MKELFIFTIITALLIGCSNTKSVRSSNARAENHVYRAEQARVHADMGQARYHEKEAQRIREKNNEKIDSGDIVAGIVS